ncbi:MAG: phospholipase D-like domain-containing protein [Acidobacteriaceae bacterium]|jgi:phosphatidylserine/phosphatidylglycerophosphate/cardiolipin synthase-like enzyme
MCNAVAFANNDIITIAWSYGKRPDGCMGFALFRIDNKGNETALPSHAVFEGDTIKPGQTTEEFPVQKFYWKDVYARPLADKLKLKNPTFRYKIVPMEGTPGQLTSMSSLPILTTNEVTLTAECSASVSAVFNRGLLSTQHVSYALKGKIDPNSLKNSIAKPGNQLRLDLAGDMVVALTEFLKRASSGGAINAALYELTDVQLIQGLVDLGSKLQIVVADIVAPKPKDGTTAVPGENDPAWKKIHPLTKGNSFYRKPPSGHIVHNKFLVYSDSHGPKAVLTGSTNWTDTGLCAQTNNALIIEDANVAAHYLTYWNTLKADDKAVEAGSGKFQGSPMRTFDSTGKPYTLDKSSKVDSPAELMSYFSPNTPAARSAAKKKSGNEATPVDMKDLSARVKMAKQAVLFLAFIPGTPSITEFAASAQRANKDLFVRGCVTSPDAAGNFYYDLKGSSPPKTKPVKGKKKAPPPENPRVLAATALDKSKLPKGWEPELLKAGFAIIHDKIVVIDPFDDENCTVVTGSHNLGYQASYNNDENLVIIKGNKKLAMAYATHVLDVYDHFAWRWSVKNGDEGYDATLKSTPNEWLSWYFDADGNIKTAQLKFWMQATV